MIAESKLNIVKDSTITDGEISQEEFKMILDEIEKHKKLKDHIRSKQTGVSEEEK